MTTWEIEAHPSSLCGSRPSQIMHCSSLDWQAHRLLSHLKICSATWSHFSQLFYQACSLCFRCAKHAAHIMSLFHMYTSEALWAVRGLFSLFTEEKTELRGAKKSTYKIIQFVQWRQVIYRLCLVPEVSVPMSLIHGATIRCKWAEWIVCAELTSWLTV